MLLLLLACSNDASRDTTATAGTDTGATTDASAACEVVGDRPAGWDDATHSKKGEADDATVFDRSAVLRVDSTVAAADYEAAYTELSSLLGGEFGSGGSGGPSDGGGGPPSDLDPQAAMEACSALAEGDACSVDVDGVATDGSCVTSPEGDLMCMPGEMGGGGGATVVAEDPSYFEATVAVDGGTWCHVGMRFKGNSTLQQTWQQGVSKLPFRLDFDRFEDDHPEIEDQGFHGFSDLTFGNNMGDATYIRDVMASTILEDRGVPAAHNRFAAVFLDAGDGPTYLGLYTMMEDPSDYLVTRVFGDDEGNLYEGDGTCATLGCYDAASFAPKNHDDADGAEVVALVDALAADRTDAAAWRAGLEAVLDVDAFLHWLAVNSAMENWDTYGAMTHNYYLYADPEDGGRIQWIPWDHNLSLMDGMQGSTDPLLDDVSDAWPLIRELLDDPEYAAIYQGYLVDALDGAYTAEVFEQNAEAWRAEIEPYVIGDAGEVAGSTFVDSEAAWESGYEALYTHRDAREATVEEALDEVGALAR